MNDKKLLNKDSVISNKRPFYNFNIISNTIIKDYKLFFEGKYLMIKPLNKKAFKTLKSFDKTILKNLDCYFMVLNESKFFELINR